MPDLYKIVTDRIHRDLETAMDKEAEELSEGEKFALCYAAGVQFHSVVDDDYIFTFKTVNPCAVVKIDGKFQVYERQDS
ncbi:hypothetical protein SYK_07210 [Pseudodesulfovibrio nedwellii]|uniref:Halobacterial output domain-containing protein n=1 Tax=Pseudodesulfovibrio nedwellii TaxID=2973072 RepID=A0ABN6S368_9BACT|nr:hypothetical protein [Pseudodesulfovibrio nedwellii]BDQ36361.1 hypothetical protein SYK_07210 [Pseudodesulfovibrio nedwellii]